MSCDSVFHQYLQSIAEFWPVRFSLALSLAPSSSGFCNSLTNKLLGVGGGGRNRTDAYSFCRAVPYHLATPPIAARSIIEFPSRAREDLSPVQPSRVATEFAAIAPKLVRLKNSFRRDHAGNQ